MATEVKYVAYAEGVFVHVRLMRLVGEERYGVFGPLPHRVGLGAPAARRLVRGR